MAFWAFLGGIVVGAILMLLWCFYSLPPGDDEEQWSTTSPGAFSAPPDQIDSSKRDAP
jgi:hypothetical protein